MTVRRNMIANLVGKGWTGLMSLVFVPIYIRLLGMEAYGLIGFFVSLQAVLTILDMGLSTTITRELARLSAAEGTEQESKDLVRTLEVVYWLVGIVIGIGLVGMAPLVARYWINPDGLGVKAVEQAVMLMGLVAAFQWPASFYSGGLLGLQRQVELNWIRSGVSTVQGVGAVLFLWLVYPSIQAFFLWQVLSNLLGTALLMRCLWSALPVTSKPASFRGSIWSNIRQFTLGMSGISVTTVVLTQLDKLILSKSLPLSLFGYYALASTIASTLNYLVNPVFSTLFPRFSQLLAAGKEQELSALYHKSCQLLTVAMAPLWVVIAFFSKELLNLVFGDPLIVRNAHWLLSLIITGTALNSLVTLPFALQLASGWTRLSLYKNMVAAALLVPLMLWMVSLYGAVGAAIVWIILNAGYVLLEIPIMHRRLLKGQMWRWYLSDVGLPLAISTLVGIVARVLLPVNAPLVVVCLWMGIAFSLALTLSMLVSTHTWAKKRFAL